LVGITNRVIPVNNLEELYDVGKEYTLFDLKVFKRKQADYSGAAEPPVR